MEEPELEPRTSQSSTACTSSIQDFNIPQEVSFLGLTDRSLLKHRPLLLYQIFKYYFPNTKNSIYFKLLHRKHSVGQRKLLGNDYHL